jgi:hypothetical protein
MAPKKAKKKQREMAQNDQPYQNCSRGDWCRGSLLAPKADERNQYLILILDSLRQGGTLIYSKASMKNQILAESIPCVVNGYAVTKMLASFLHLFQELRVEDDFG